MDQQADEIIRVNYETRIVKKRKNPKLKNEDNRDMTLVLSTMRIASRKVFAKA